ncbi:MAG TPA: hypothetical protein VFM48_15985 [Aquabacterium sp.]|nr:hypothetical protein [Aquabacterium sp.]
MKKWVVMTAAAVVSSVAFGQEYMGLSLGHSYATNACPQPGLCSKGAQAGKILVGGFSNDSALKAVGASGYEFSYIRFGRTSNRFTQLLPQQNANAVAGAPDYTLAYGYYDNRGQTHAMTAAVVWRASLLPTTAVVGRFGLAYVTTSLTTLIDGARSGQVTASKVKPYVGLGVEQQVLPSTKVSASVDWTRYSLQGYSGAVRMVGLGVQQDF